MPIPEMTDAEMVAAIGFERSVLEDQPAGYRRNVNKSIAQRIDALDAIASRLSALTRGTGGVAELGRENDALKRTIDDMEGWP